jgi:hypothetical protein
MTHLTLFDNAIYLGNSRQRFYSIIIKKVSLNKNNNITEFYLFIAYSLQIPWTTIIRQKTILSDELSKCRHVELE